MSWPADATVVHKHVLKPGLGPTGFVGTSKMSCGLASWKCETLGEAWVNDDWLTVTCAGCQAAMPRPIAVLLDLLPFSLHPDQEEVERWLAS